MTSHRQPTLPCQDTRPAQNHGLTTMAIGEEDGSWRHGMLLTTMAIGEEGPRAPFAVPLDAWLHQ